MICEAIFFSIAAQIKLKVRKILYSSSDEDIEEEENGSMDDASELGSLGEIIDVDAQSDSPVPLQLLEEDDYPLPLSQ